MIPQEQALAKQRRYQSSMGGLIADPRFFDFIDALREDREQAIRNLFDKGVVGNASAKDACIGEIATYTDIIARYDEARNRRTDETE